MIDHVIAFSIRQRWLVIAAAALLAAWGVFAIYHTPMDAIPDLSENQVIVFTDWPGHSPQEIEDQVTFPLAVNLQGIAGVRVVRSSSDVNFSMLHVIFEDSVGVATARRRVDEQLTRGAADLPAGVRPYLAPEAPATGQIFWYTVEGAGYDLGQLRAIQDWYVRHQLASVAGVAEVASVGGFPIEYQIDVDPHKLALHGVTLGEVVAAVSRDHSTVGGHVIQKAGQEYVVRSTAWLGVDASDHFDAQQVVRDLEQVVIPRHGRAGELNRDLDEFVLLGDVAAISIGPGPRRGVLEKDGNEVVGGVVLMRYGENPLEVTQRLREKIRQLQIGLPAGVRIVTGYDRTPLIRAAVATVTGTLLEAIVTASICVLLVMLHFRSSLVIAMTLPLAVLASFAMMWTLRQLGIADVQTNIMSIAGLAISIGVLVDSSIVMTENVMHNLRGHFGDRPVRGDVRHLILPACQMVGRPIFFSVLIMLLSFLPVFALGGLEGKMFRPLALTKSFALIAVAGLAITLVPALCTLLVKGRMRAERESWLVRSFEEVYRPLLNFLLDRPAAMLWVMGVTFVVGFAPLGSSWGLRLTVGAALLACGWTTRRTWTRVASLATLLVIGLCASRMKPLEHELVTPLDEGTVMDMPITIPRMSVTQAADDLKARDMILCRFPEVEMVMGKAGRAETPTDPAPIDMIETMVSFRPREFWPKRKLLPRDARRQTETVLRELIDKNLLVPPADTAARAALVDQTLDAALPRFDGLIREYAYQRNQEHTRELAAKFPGRPIEELRSQWPAHVDQLNAELIDRAAATCTRLALEELLSRGEVRDPDVAAAVKQLRQLRTNPPPAKKSLASHHGSSPPPDIDPIPGADELQSQLSRQFARRLVLWRAHREDLGTFGGEMDQAVQMPGWTNVWTRPIQNRVDMLSTGVDSTVGIRVLGHRQEDVVRASEEIAAVVKTLAGATNVIADPIRGKGYLDIRIDRERAARFGVSVGDIQDVVETATGGKVVATTVEGRQRHAVRMRFPRAWREDEETLRRLPIPIRAANDYFVPTSTQQDINVGSVPRQVTLAEVATVETRAGPAAIKGENGLLRNYVRLEVRGRDAIEFVAQAKQVVERQVRLPAGVYIEWTGRFERWERSVQALRVVVPLVVLLILLILYFTYHDFADALLMLLAVPGAIAGGLLLQWLWDTKFSVTVAIGYIACFGMATATGIIMLVYLREAVHKAGGLERMTLDQLRQAVLDGAVHRLRPKLLTEATTIIGLAPMLWATGVGAEVIRPMAVPVMGGILIADEVIDLFLPVMFFWVRRRRWQRLQSQNPNQDSNGNQQNILPRSSE